MILSSDEIRDRCCNERQSLIGPFNEVNLLADSYALTFDGLKFYRCFKTYQVGRRPYAVETFEAEKIWVSKKCRDCQSLLLNAGDKIVIQTKEKIDLSADGKIAYADIRRLDTAMLSAGLLVVPATDFLPANYSGSPQLLVENLSHVPITIRDGYQLAQVVFHV